MSLDGIIPRAEAYDMWCYVCPTCQFHFNMVEARTDYSAAISERRLVLRYRVTKHAMMEFEGSSGACTIRDISAMGAGLDLPDRSEIPLEFVLVANGIRMRCCRIWQSEQRIGLVFD